MPFFLIADALNLVKDHPELIGCIRLQAQGNLPVVVVIDTLNRSLAGSESDDKDMAAYVRAADAIRHAFGCVVIIVHHCGVDAYAAARSYQPDRRRRRATRRQARRSREHRRHGRTYEGRCRGRELVSKLEAVKVGIDVDGDAITSCVVVPVDGAAVRTQPAQALRPPKART